MRALLATCISFALLTPAVCPAQQGTTQPILTPAPRSAPQPDVPPVAPADPATPAPPADIPASYLIGPQDAIQVNVWKEPSLSAALTVRPDGMISLPLLGDLQAAGYTPMALGKDIQAKLKKYLTDPLVTVTVATVNSKHIYMVGEVQHIGSLPLLPDMTPMQAIASSGGLTPYANQKKIYILRGEGTKQQKIPFNYKKAVKDGNQQGVALMPGDTIVVP